MKLPLGTRLIASLFLIGEKAPFAPATWASLAVLPVMIPYVSWSLGMQLGLTLVITAVGTWAATQAEHEYGHDGSPIVIDEVAGMLVTFGGAWTVSGSPWLFFLTGFLLFRLFDILKPFPVGRLQNLPRGYGVMADDLLAGVYANLVLRVLVLRFF